MIEPALVALTRLKERLDNHAHENMVQANPDVFNHGRQVGIYHGIQYAIEEIHNALSAGDEADAKL